MNTAHTDTEQEIDLLALLFKIWKGKKTIFLSFIIFFLLGLFVAIFSQKQYKASCVVVPQTKSSDVMGGLGGLAALAGINLNAGNNNDYLAPKLFPIIAKTIPFQQQMLQTTINVEGVEKPITYAQYYGSYQKEGVLDIVKKYTIGLPGMIIGLLSQEEQLVSSPMTTDKESNILTLTPIETALLGQLSRQLNVNYAEKDGTITLTFTMPEALAAAQMLEKAQQYLQEAVTKLKIEKAQGQLDFIEKRYNEAKEQYKATQLKLAAFQDNNRGLISSLSQTQQSRLEFEFNMAFNIYNELNKQLEAQRIKVKEETPVFTVIEPVSVPVHPSKPQRLFILMVWSILGIFLGIGIVFTKDILQNFKKSSAE